MSASLIRLLGTFKSIKPSGDLKKKYEQDFSVFKLRNPALHQKI